MKWATGACSDLDDRDCDVMISQGKDTRQVSRLRARRHQQRTAHRSVRIGTSDPSLTPNAGLAELSNRRQPAAWMIVMLKKRRKALVTCRECHTAIHATG
jgi:hypothetical protein